MLSLLAAKGELGAGCLDSWLRWKEQEGWPAATVQFLRYSCLMLWLPSISITVQFLERFKEICQILPPGTQNESWHLLQRGLST